MTHKVLKPFPYAPDGKNTREARVDEVLTDIPVGSVDGLISEGYIANAAAAETLSKIAGDAMVSADLAGAVDSDKAVKEEAASAQARISDGHIGAPEAATIVDAHVLTDLSDPVAVQAAQDEKAAHEAGDTNFDPKAPENVAAAAEKVDGDADDKKGGRAPKARA
jgi:hypothetical protein